MSFLFFHSVLPIDTSRYDNYWAERVECILADVEHGVQPHFSSHDVAGGVSLSEVSEQIPFLLCPPYTTFPSYS